MYGGREGKRGEARKREKREERRRCGPAVVSSL